ncbi:MAG: response regulator transcription factor [Rhodospirillaceae bacterium]
MLSSPQPETLRIGVISRHLLAQDILSSWMEGIVVHCEISHALEVSALDHDMASCDILILGRLFDTAPSAAVQADLAALRKAGLAAPVVVVADTEDGAVAVDCILRGARGFIPTSSSVRVAAAAVRLVLSGGTYIPPAALFSRHGQPDGETTAAEGPETAPFLPSPASAAQSPDHPPPTLPAPQVEPQPYSASALSALGLSPREGQILLLLQLGRSNRIIAEDLAISENTVMVHVRNLMRKLGATNRTQAVFNATRRLVQKTEKALSSEDQPGP